jgi:hypothetical protein
VKLEKGTDRINAKGWELRCYLPIKVDALNLRIMPHKMTGTEREGELHEPTC